MRRLLLVLTAAAIALTLSGCGGGSSASDPNPSVVSSAAPNFQAFLREPVATPSACPSNVSGTTDGRTSVWAGRVDLSVFVSPTASAAATRAIGTALRADSRVKTIYFETKQQAFEEFQRLYTCWAGVPRSATPASYRVDLDSTVSLAERNALVTTISRLPDVDTVACNPVVPCITELPSPTPSPSSAP
jgi:hypothetical protein